MKLLENRTEQSRNEIELLESLEELKDLRTRHENIDYEALLHQYDPTETVQQREERLAKLDDEYVKTVKFQNPSNNAKRVVEEIIEEIKDDDDTMAQKPKIESFAPRLPKQTTKKPLVLVKKKDEISSSTAVASKTLTEPVIKPSGLSLLSAYSDSDSNGD